MVGSINKVILVGNVGAQPEVRETTSGLKVAQFSLATTDRWKDKSTHETREKTEWHRVVCFDPLASIVEQYVQKGTQVYVEGKLQTRKWQDSAGNDRYTTEVAISGFGGQLVLLSSRSATGGGGYSKSGETATGGTGGGGTGVPQGGATGETGGGTGAEDEFFDDDIPF